MVVGFVKQLVSVSASRVLQTRIRITSSSSPLSFGKGSKSSWVKYFNSLDHSRIRQNYGGPAEIKQGMRVGGGGFSAQNKPPDSFCSSEYGETNGVSSVANAALPLPRLSRERHDKWTCRLDNAGTNRRSRNSAILPRINGGDCANTHAGYCGTIRKRNGQGRGLSTVEQSNHASSVLDYAREEAGDSPYAGGQTPCLGSTGDEDLTAEEERLARMARPLVEESTNPETRKLMLEFEAAKQALEVIPDALRDIPLMDPRGVYANHNLRLDRINVYGFDYDYTLAHYTKELHSLIYDLAKQHLVQELRYPESCLSFQYDPSFPIRGLYYDKQKGFLLKLDFFHTVEAGASYFGRRQVSQAELDVAYGGSHISVEHMPNLAPLLDLFALSETCLISDVIQHFVDQRLGFDAAYVYEDVRRCIEHVHRSQSMHREILRNPARYLLENEAIPELLRALRSRGKQLFMLTNSPFPFVDGGMRFLFQEDGQGGASWRELFDVIIALSDKPTFYHSTRPFRTYSRTTGNLGFRRVEAFSPGGVYYHGCLKDFLNLTNYRGSEVLYFGDQVYTDLRGPQRAGWRTAAIIHELEEDIRISNDPLYRFNQAKYHIVQELLGKYHRMAPSRGAAEQALFAALNAARAEARGKMRAMFNPHFGSPFLTSSGKESAFAYNVQRYADVYTSRLDNFLEVSSDAWLYTPHDVKILPHHVKVGPSLVLKSCT